MISIEMLCRSRARAIALLCLTLAGCDPVPYGRVRLAPVPPDRALRAADVSAIAARVLVRQGFVAQPESCFGSGQKYTRQVSDTTEVPWGPVDLIACVLPEPKDPYVWFSEARLSWTLLAPSDTLMRELADSLRTVAQVRVKTR